MSNVSAPGAPNTPNWEPDGNSPIQKTGVSSIDISVSNTHDLIKLVYWASGGGTDGSASMTINNITTSDYRDRNTGGGTSISSSINIAYMQSSTPFGGEITVLGSTEGTASLSYSVDSTTGQDSITNHGRLYAGSSQSVNSLQISLPDTMDFKAELIGWSL